MMSTAKSHPIWNYFKKSDGGNRSSCNKCCTQITCLNSGTTNMIQHLQRKHLGLHKLYSEEKEIWSAKAKNQEKKAQYDSESSENNIFCPCPSLPQISWSRSNCFGHPRNSCTEWKGLVRRRKYCLRRQTESFTNEFSDASFFEGEFENMITHLLLP